MNRFDRNLLLILIAGGVCQLALMAWMAFEHAWPYLAAELALS